LEGRGPWKWGEGTLGGWDPWWLGSLLVQNS
jgi:hypothetical protein